MGGKTRTSGQGRPKGIPNKNTTALKDMILSALDGVGGAEYLQRQARENPGPFLTLVGKVLPLQVNNSGDIGLKIELVKFADRSSAE